MEPATIQLISNYIFIGVFFLLGLIGVSVYISRSDGEKKAQKSMTKANARYGVNLTWDDVLILKEYYDTSGTSDIHKIRKFVGPRGDNTIDVFIDTNLISNVSLEDNKGNWVLKSNGVELQRVKA